MKDIEKKLKKHYQNNLQHESRLLSIKEKVSFNKPVSTPWYKKKIFVIPASISLCGASSLLVVLGIVVSNNNQPNDIKDIANVKNAIIKMDINPNDRPGINPEVVISVDKNGQVCSYYGTNDDGKLITNNESFIGEYYWDVMKQIYTTEINTGFLLKGDVKLPYNKVNLNIYSDNGDYGENIKQQVIEYLSSNDVNVSDEDVTSNDSNNYSELDDSDYIEISDEESFDDVQDKIDEYYQQVSSYSATIIKEFYELCNYFQNKLAYFETAMEQLTSSWFEYEIYSKKLDDIKQSLDEYSTMYNEKFLLDNSMYMSYYQKLMENKIQVISFTAEIAEEEDSKLIEELAKYESSLDASFKTLDSFRKTILNAWSTRIEQAMASLNEFSNLLNYQDFRDVIATTTFNDQYIENHMTYLNELEEKYGQRKTYWSNYINSVKNQLIENIKKL